MDTNQTEPTVEQQPEPTPENPNKAMIAELRAMADFMETHPQMGEFYGNLTLLIPCKDKTDLIERIKGAGKLHKKAVGDYFDVNKWFGDHVRIEWYLKRDLVCERIVDQRVVPAEPEKIIPEQIIPAKPERVIEEVSWKCPESLLAEAR